MTYDPDAIYQDADIEMAELARRADEQDVCDHESVGWTRDGAFAPRRRCLDCGAVLT